MQGWHDCKKILCIRPDNMGDLLMTTPALRALKHTFDAHITVLTSSMAAGIAKYIPEIDDVIIFDVPWVKTSTAGEEDAVFNLVPQLRLQQFDAAVIFTVYSQNPMPTIMLAYLAGIPLRLAYCRENPYQLLTHWVPDKEPYTFIKHQVRRDLDLVAHLGAVAHNEDLSLTASTGTWHTVQQKLQQQGINFERPWLIMHPGVSEPKRQYPSELWAETAHKVVQQMGYQVLFTGAPSEQLLAGTIHAEAGLGTFNIAGLLSLEELILLLQQAGMLVSVNTGTIHIAAALKTPVVVLYALTNPQHTPWKTECQILPFAVPAETQSRNEVIQYVNQYFSNDEVPMPCPGDIIKAIQTLLTKSSSAKQLTDNFIEIGINGAYTPADSN